MHKSRLEAFSDGVIAIIITIMVLEMKVPTVSSWQGLNDAVGHKFLGYVFSFIQVGIYWNNHHHLFQAVHRVDGAVLWANLHLLFWLSLLPFASAWMGEQKFAAEPTALYGVILIGAAVAYFILTRVLLRIHAVDSPLAKALGRDIKGKLSLLIYTLGILATLVSKWLPFGFYSLVVLIWLVPDRRIEKTLDDRE